MSKIRCSNCNHVFTFVMGDVCPKCNKKTEWKETNEKTDWHKRYLEQRPDMQVSTKVEPRLLNEDKMLEFVSREFRKLEESLREGEAIDGTE